MGTPAQYLPGRIDEASIKALMVSIGLPTPLLIGLTPVIAQYHGIYFIASLWSGFSQEAGPSRFGQPSPTHQDRQRSRDSILDRPEYHHPRS